MTSMNFSRLRLSLEFLINFNCALPYYVAEIPYRDSVVLRIIIYLIFVSFSFQHDPAFMGY